MAVSNLETASVPNDNKWRDKDYLTPTQAADLLGIGRMSIYRYICNGKIKVVRFQQKTLISKADIHAIFDFLTPKESKPSASTERKSKSISDFYTCADIREKYGVKDSWIYKEVRRTMCQRQSSEVRRISASRTSTGYYRQERRIRK